jgi:hypothetical protein
MAREEQDREDLLAEAVALVERVEIAAPIWTEHIVAGFRRDGCASLYFGSDPAYHFNTKQELRRAFVGGLLYKAERGKLVSLKRERTAGEVRLLAHELSEVETGDFLAALNVQVNRLLQTLQAGDYQIIGQVPGDTDVIGRLRPRLAELGETIDIAVNPRAG